MLFLSRNWFLFCLPLSVGLAFFFPTVGAAHGWLQSQSTTKIAVVCIFLLQGLTLPSSTLRKGLTDWRLHLLVQGVTFLAFPLIGIGLNQLLGRFLPPDLALGFLYLCVLPSTISSSVVLTGVAGGNTVGALFNAVLSNVLGVFITPLWIAWLLRREGTSQPLGPLFIEILSLLLAPLILGQLLRLRLSRFMDGRKKIAANLASGCILYLVFAAFCNSVQSKLWTLQGPSVLALASAGVLLLFVIVAGLTEVASRLLKLNRADHLAAAFCAPQKTLASGLPMAKIIFDGHPAFGLIVLPVLIYHPLQLFVCGLLAVRWRRLSAESKSSE